MSTENEPNKKSFLALMGLDVAKKKFVAFVDGDLVDQGDNHIVVATNAAEAASLRGMPGQQGVFSTDEKVETPH